MTKTGSSKVTLAGNNTYAGSTTVAGGTLAMTGNAALSGTTGVEVQAGATFDVSGRNGGGITFNSGQSLSGSGDVIGNVAMANGSTLQPGSALGELSISGDVTLSSGSALDIEIGGAAAAGTDYDQLDVGGSFQLAGGDLNVSFVNGFMPVSGASFDVLDFASLTGSFGSLNLPGLAGGMTWDTSNLLSTGVLSISGGVLACDADGDGDCQLDDINAMYAAEGTAGSFDFDGNGTIGDEDIGDWLAAASSSNNLANPLGRTIAMGDLDLSFEVDSTDLGLMLNNFGANAGSAAAGPGWGGGDVNMDGDVDSTDLGLLLNEFGFVGAASAAVPEPSSATLLLVTAMLGLAGFRRRANR